MVEISRDWGMVACKALDLDPGKVRRLEVRATPQDALTVTVEMYATAEELKGATEQLAAYVGKILLSNGDDTFCVTIEHHALEEQD